MCDDCGGVGPTYERLADARRSASLHRCARRCVGCKWARGIRGQRGLCSRCYHSDTRFDHGLQFYRGTDLIEDVEWLIDDDATLTIACGRLDIKRDTLWRALRRAGRLDLWDRLMDREPYADTSRALRRADLRAAS